MHLGFFFFVAELWRWPFLFLLVIAWWSRSWRNASRTLDLSLQVCSRKSEVCKENRRRQTHTKKWLNFNLSHIYTSLYRIVLYTYVSNCSLPQFVIFVSETENKPFFILPVLECLLPTPVSMRDFNTPLPFFSMSWSLRQGSGVIPQNVSCEGTLRILHTQCTLGPW